ncbi:uncharacterized protein FFC1_05204 [Fusarium fujikuroi]|nr:uncharacterized protein FFC1_05204 [Fusarium fujikuroi]
MHFKKNL